MKIVTKITFSLAAVSMMFFTGCYDTTPAKQEVVKPAISEESLGLRKVDLYTEDSAKPDETKYSKEYAGSGYKINRAFQDAPPMIPHDVDGMLPITINDNQCVGCHMPEVASSVDATSVPPSHMIDFRPITTIAEDGRIAKNGKAVDNTSSDKLENVTIKKKDTLAGARFNCSQCHAPQSDGQVVENTFTPDYISNDGANKSSWDGSKLTEGLDTLMK